MTWFGVFTLFGGMGLFLYGMQMMGEGLQSAAGSRMKGILEALTRNQFMGVLVGTLVTMIIQSSAATIVMAIGFVNAGMMSLQQAYGLLLGANIGTTITGQIIAFKLTDWAPLFIVLGVIPLMFAKRRRTQSIGRIIAGFGILFFGLTTMSDAMIPLRTEQWFIDLMTSFSNPLLGVLMGLIFTAVIQSSSASVGVVQMLALQGLVGLDASLYIVLGCNIGTCVPTLLASINTNTMARRTSIMHLCNKVVGVLIFIVVVSVFPISQWVAVLNPADPARQIANFHTIFNILNTLMLLPMGKYIIKLSYFIIKDSAEDEMGRLRYLDERSLDNPTIAMVQLHEEVAHLAGQAAKNVQLAAEAFFEQDADKVEACFLQEQNIDFISSEITGFVVKIQAQPQLSELDERQLFRFYEAIGNIERVGDHAENIAEFAEERINTNAPFTLDALSEMMEMTNYVTMALRKGVEVLKGGMNDAQYQAAVDQCYEYEERVDSMHAMMREHHIQRLSIGQCDPRAGMIFTDMAIDLERIADHAVNMTSLRNTSTVGAFEAFVPAD